MKLLILITPPVSVKNTALIVGEDTGSLIPEIEALNGKGRVEVTNGAEFIERLKAIREGRKEPCFRYLAGNEYYGPVRLEFRYIDKPGTTGSIKVKVFSALGNTVEEHYERYERNKQKKYENTHKQCQS